MLRAWCRRQSDTQSVAKPILMTHGNRIQNQNARKIWVFPIGHIWATPQGPTSNALKRGAILAEPNELQLPCLVTLLRRYAGMLFVKVRLERL